MKTEKPFNKRQNKNSKWMILYALWIVLILLSQVPFLAETLVDTSEMDDTVESHLRFPQDGKQGHYYVERYDSNQNGLINVVYTTDSNSLEVDCTNIKVLRIYCREMYEKKSEEVFKRDPELDSNYYKTYFIERDHFHVHVYTQDLITELAFIDTPIPYNVTVNSQEWWLTGINYTYENDGIVLTKVPPGHNYVDLYFKSKDLNSPVARFTTSKTIFGVGESITLNASSSYDVDGEIISYVWDLGEGSYKIGVSTEHSYAEEGNYNVILTVKDDDYLIDRAFEKIIVVQRVMSVSKSVDKPIATPGSILTYTLTPTLNSSWQEGVKEVIVTDILPDGLEYADATPQPSLDGKTVTWKLGSVSDSSELPQITLQTTIDKYIENGTIISNYAMLDYKGLDDQGFPQELSNLVNTKVNIGSILAPKIRSPVPNVILSEDDPPFNLFLGPYEYDLQDSGTGLRWYITDNNESLYILSGEYSDEDLLTITPLPNAYGNNLVTLWLVDSEGYTVNQPLWINITPINDNPIFSSAPNLIIHYDDPYTFDYEPYIEDIDTPLELLQLFVSENIEGMETDSTNTNNPRIQVSGFKVTYNYPESCINKQIFISLIAFDGNGSDGDTIQINVTDNYSPKLKSELPDVLLEEGEIKYNVFDLNDHFEDPDENSLFYSIGDTHVSVIINENHSVDISSPSGWNGVDIVTFRARDPIGAIAEDTILVTVVPVNDPPVIEGVPDIFIVHYDADYSFDLTPYISDEDNDIDELFLILSDEYIRTDPVNTVKIIMNYPEELIGMEIPVRLIVSDGLDTGSTEVTVKVTDDWPPEILKTIPDISFYEDEIVKNLFDLNEYFSDRDSNALYFSYGQENVNIIINSNGSVDFSALPNWNGVETVTFRATDPTDAFAENIITVTVIPVNDAPIIQPIPDQIGIAKNLWRVDLTEFIDDIDNDITELKISVISNKLDIIISGRELVIYSEKPLIEKITITVNDGLEEASGTMLIEIQEEHSKSAAMDNNLISLLWLLILIIIIIVTLTGYTAWRRYVGNYRTEEVFWIYNDGILIFHETSKKTKRRADKNIVSGMLTGILDFTQEAFSEEELNKKEWGIKEIQMNGKNILVERGNYTFLATIFSGRSGKKLYAESRNVLKIVESKYKKKLKDWDGNTKKLIGAKKILKSMVTSKIHNNSKLKKVN